MKSRGVFSKSRGDFQNPGVDFKIQGGIFKINIFDEFFNPRSKIKYFIKNIDFENPSLDFENPPWISKYPLDFQESKTLEIAYNMKENHNFHLNYPKIPPWVFKNTPLDF